MEILGSFREYVEHNPDLALNKRLIINASNLYFSYQRLINRFVRHTHHSIRTAVSYLSILVKLGYKNKIVDRIFYDLLVFLSLKKLPYKPYESYLPILIYLFVDE